MKNAFEFYERTIADLLWYGTWIASAAILAGLLIGLEVSVGSMVANLGIAFFILLPISRVALLVAMFLKEKDLVYIAISASVLAILAISAIVGFYRMTLR